MRRAAALSILFFALNASAADSPEVIAARAAYNRGVAAFEAKDYATAARAFAEADATVKNDVALGAAIDAAMRADEPVLVMELVERAEERKLPVGDARAKFGKRVGRVRVTCTCTATLDGKDLPVGKARIVTLGHHALLLTSGSKTEARSLEVTGNEEIAWAPAADAPPTPKPTPSGISPVWFWTAAGVSAVLVGATTWSALSVRSDHATFSEACKTPSARCDALSEDGLAAQRRTNILLASSIVAVGATAIIGAFAVRWSVDRESAVATIALKF
jgi:hypothetical protein